MPLSNSKYMLVVIDHYSKWCEKNLWKNTLLQLLPNFFKKK